jgi:uncharacterized protein YxjI
MVAVSDISAGTIVNQGYRAVINNTMLAAHDPDSLPFVYRITTAPTSGTLFLKGVPLKIGDTFTQEDVDNTHLLYEHEGLVTTADTFEYVLVTGTEVSAEAAFTVSVAAQNNGFLLTLVHIGGVVLQLRFSRKSAAETYRQAWDMTHVGISMYEELDTIDTEYNYVPLNRADAAFNLTDQNYFLDTRVVKNATDKLIGMLSGRDARLKAMIRQFGDLLELDPKTAALANAVSDWALIKSAIMADVRLYFAWVAVLRLARATLQ